MTAGVRTDIAASVRGSVFSPSPDSQIWEKKTVNLTAEKIYRLTTEKSPNLQAVSIGTLFATLHAKEINQRQKGDFYGQDKNNLCTHGFLRVIPDRSAPRLRIGTISGSKSHRL